MQTRREKKRADAKVVVGYVRVSTDEQALSPEAQREAMRVWCERHEATIVSVHDDIGIGGGTPVEKRPGLNLALHAAADVGAGVILVAKRDRLTRDVVVGAVAERMAERIGARILSADGTGDDDDKVDREDSCCDMDASSAGSRRPDQGVRQARRSCAFSGSKSGSICGVTTLEPPFQLRQATLQLREDDYHRGHATAVWNLDDGRISDVRVPIAVVP